MKHLLHPAVAALCAATAINAAASDSQPTDSAVVSLRDVEIVANRAAAKTPVAYTNVSGAELERANDGRDIPFLIESTPSMVTTGDAGGGIGYSSMRIRGVDATRINVTANGVPINDSEGQQVYWVNMPDLASSLRDIQIQRGAGTSTNGAGAFGASVNMLTDAPSMERYAYVGASYGSYNANRQTVKVASGLFGDHWSVDARFSHIGSDGYLDRAFSKLWSYQGQLAYLADNTSVRLIAFGGKEKTYMAWDYASKEEMAEFGRRYNPCGEYTAADGSTAYYKDQCDNFVQHHIQLILNQRLGRDWNLNIVGHYTKGDGYYDQYKTKRTLIEYGLAPYMDADGNEIEKSDLIRLKFNDNDFGGATLNLRYSNDRIQAVLGTAANWFRGLHYGEIKWVRNYIGALDPNQEYYNNIGRKFDYNVFARADYSIIPELSAYADLQYRHVRYTIRGVSDNFDYNTMAMAGLDVHENYNFFNPKVGLTYTNGMHRAFASWSVAHKEPVRDNFTDGDPNHRPDPERLFDYELGYTFNHRLFTVGVNLYYMDYKDQLVVTGQLSDTGNPLSVNVPKSYRMGIELQGALRPCTWFDWGMNLTLSRNRVKDFVEYIYEEGWHNPITRNCGDTPLAFSPDMILNNDFNFHFRGFDATARTRFVSSQYMDNAKSSVAKLPSYCVTDLHLGYTFKNIRGVKALRLGVAVYNIFNKKYCNNGWTSAEYYVEDGHNEVYRYAGFAPQATTNAMGTVALTF